MGSSNTFINVSYMYQKIYDLLSGQYLPGSDAVFAVFSVLLNFIRPLSVTLSLLFLTGIVYCIIRTRAIFHEAEEKAHAHASAVHAEASGETVRIHSHSMAGVDAAVNKRSEKIAEHINSTNPSDWRLAILECDIILDEMLTKMSYHGETIADKLQAVEKSDFLSIDKAWEAHRVRNAIAHQGSDFQITDREARRVVGLYEEVFREFHYI